MNLLEIALIYTDLVKVEEEVPEFEYHAKDSLNALRSKYHDLLMQKMREENIDFYDRFDAARKAFEIVQEESKIES